MYQALPDFLAKIKYQDLVDNHNTVFQEAYKTKGTPFGYMETHPQSAAYFNKYMAHRRKGMNTWLSVFPVEEEAKDYDPNGVIFIDIGGNIGHQCAELKAKYPKLPGRVVLQDLPHAIGMALQTPGVEHNVHDIFTLQPINGICPLNNFQYSN
jgi:demethylsterigmatocystin 6-O-methyltransferase